MTIAAAPASARVNLFISISCEAPAPDSVATPVERGS
jgi:hypothetical protein